MAQGGRVRAIVDGSRDAETLARFRNVRCKASEETLCKAFTGNYRAEHVFALRQALELYDTYQDKLRDCDLGIERVLTERNRERELPLAPVPKKRNRQWQKNEPGIEIQSALFTLAGGVDLTQIHGLGPYSASLRR